MNAAETLAETVALGVPDAYGRLIGKRLTRDTWERVEAEGTFPMPDFHLITDAANGPVPDMAAAGLHNGFRNGLLRPDAATMRTLAWHEGTALVLCDALDASGSPTEAAPRWILRRQVERLAAAGLAAGCASELEFYAYRTSYEDLARAGHGVPPPAFHRAGDNDLLIDGYLEPLLGAIRRLMPESGIPVELSQGEGGVGQLEVALRYADPLGMADRHVVYKLGVKTLAQRLGLAVTFMAKPQTDQPGSSCHVHLSLHDGERNAICESDDTLTPLGRSFLGGLLGHAAELCLLFAPSANSYRRLQPGSWAPASVTWGVDNRTVLVRLCGARGDRRFEFRLPGADANPYLAIAGIIAAGLAGVRAGLDAPAAVVGDADATGAAPLPRDLAEAVERFGASDVAAEAFGVEVRERVAALGAHELGVSRVEVTDRDRARYFEVA